MRSLLIYIASGGEQDGETCAAIITHEDWVNAFDDEQLAIKVPAFNECYTIIELSGEHTPRVFNEYGEEVEPVLVDLE